MHPSPWIAFFLVPFATSWTTTSVPVIDIHDFEPDAYYEQNEPLLIRNALPNYEQLLEPLAKLQTTTVDLQNQVQGATYVSTINLQQALDTLLYQSSSSDAYYLLDEDILDQLPTLAQEVLSTQESFFDDADWFTTHGLAPVTNALILAGAGATSTLHRDPYEWTGTSWCLEGTKVWRFVVCEDVQQVDELLEASRPVSGAWEEASAAGWQSNRYSLYRHHRQEEIPSTEELMQWSEEERYKIVESLAHNTDILQPDVNLPHFQVAVQQAGDLLLIPPYAWHQTYAVEPSVAVSSQRCGDIDLPWVLQHMLDYVESDVSAEEVLELEEPELIVKRIKELTKRKKCQS